MALEKLWGVGFRSVLGFMSSFARGPRAGIGHRDPGQLAQGPEVRGDPPPEQALRALFELSLDSEPLACTALLAHRFALTLRGKPGAKLLRAPLYASIAFGGHSKHRLSPGALLRLAPLEPVDSCALRMLIEKTLGGKHFPVTGS